MKKYRNFDDYAKICEMIIELENLPREEVMRKCRKKEYVFVRQLCMYMGLEKTTVSQAKIGEYFGKDHATAIHARLQINNLIDTDREIRAKVERDSKMIFSELSGLTRYEKAQMVKFWILHKIPLFVREQKLLSYGQKCTLCGQPITVIRLGHSGIHVKNKK